MRHQHLGWMTTCHHSRSLVARGCLPPLPTVGRHRVISTESALGLAPASAPAADNTRRIPACNGDSKCRSSKSNIISSLSRSELTWDASAPSKLKTILPSDALGNLCRLGNAYRGFDALDLLRTNSRRKTQVWIQFASFRKVAEIAPFDLRRTYCSAHSPDSDMPSSEQRTVSGSDEYLRGGKYCVFLTGHAPDYTQRLYGGYGNLFEKLLADPEDTWDIYAVIDNQFPSEEELEKYDGFVITGSASDAHGTQDWIAKLCDVLQSLHRKKHKTLGVCFGHQVLSRALGGKTGRADVGWEIGLREIKTTSALGTKYYAEGVPSSFKILQSHKDQVQELPPGGTLLGFSGKTGIEIFAVDDHILGIQGHPEFTEDIVTDIIDGREAAGNMKKEEAEDGRATMKAGKADHDVLIQLCKRFLKGRRTE